MRRLSSPVHGNYPHPVPQHQAEFVDLDSSDVFTDLLQQGRIVRRDCHLGWRFPENGLEDAACFASHDGSTSIGTADVARHCRAGRKIFGRKTSLQVWRQAQTRPWNQQGLHCNRCPASRVGTNQADRHWQRC